MVDVAQFLPDTVSSVLAVGLIVLSFVASLITATFSLGGGSLMVVVLALVLPPAVVIPVHGLVQLGSNGGRAVLQRAHIQWRAIRYVLLGTIVGTVAGGQLADNLPAQALQGAIALFILVTTWLPGPKAVPANPALQAAGGFLVSALGMIVGAVGPLVAVFLRPLLDRRQLVATHAALMTVQNVLKALVFTAIGFGFSDYLPLIGAMILAGLGGTAIGSRLLLRVPESLFRNGFRLVLTAVALHLLFQALWPR